ncbi:MAG: hypothetical protein ABIN89_12320 [Chitinophagaceae bacterium]
MKKIFAITLFIAGFAFVSQAQQAPSTKTETKKEEHKKRVADLHLTKDQKAQLKDVNKEFKDKARAIKDNQSLSKQQKKEQFTTLHKERMDKMNTFLTPEQQAKLNEEKKEEKHRRS